MLEFKYMIEFYNGTYIAVNLLLFLHMQKDSYLTQDMRGLLLPSSLSSSKVKKPSMRAETKRRGAEISNKNLIISF